MSRENLKVAKANKISVEEAAIKRREEAAKKQQEKKLAKKRAQKAPNAPNVLSS